MLQLKTQRSSQFGAARCKKASAGVIALMRRLVGKSQKAARIIPQQSRHVALAQNDVLQGQPGDDCDHTRTAKLPAHKWNLNSEPTATQSTSTTQQ